MTDLLDRLRAALADRYAIMRVLGCREMVTVCPPHYRPLSGFDAPRMAPEMSVCRIILTVAAALSSLHCSSTGGDNSDYRTVRVTRHTLSATVTALGTVKPQVGAEVRLGARIPGKVERLRANVGDLVVKGQIIAELEKDELLAIVESERAGLDGALNNLAALEAQGPIEIQRAEADSSRLKAIHELAAIEYERQTTLFDENLTSRQNLDEARQQLAVAREELEASSKALELARSKLGTDLAELRAEVAAERATLRVAEVELSYATLRAPISGIIASVSTQEGETVAVGLSAPTFVTIIDLDRLQVETYVDEVDIGKIRVGQEAIYTVEAFPSVDIEGEVVGIYPKAILRENVVFYNVVVASHEPPPVVLRPEMTANVSIRLETREDVLMVPATSVRKSAGANFVYVLVDGNAVRREVRVGWREGRFLEITEGLEEGDELLEQHGDFAEEER